MTKPTKERRNISLEPHVDEILDHVQNASEYVAQLVVKRDREWRRALLALRADWRPPELLAACDVLNGVWMIDDALGGVGPYSSGSALALELHDGQRLNGICAKWDVSPERWAELIRKLAADDVMARSLRTVVEEFWAINEAVDVAIREG